MIQFVISPALALFSRRFYRGLRDSGPGRGLLYLLYLAILVSVLVFVLSQALLVPEIRNFSNLLIEETPEMTLTATGLTADVEQPYVVSHPEIGAMYVIDTRKNASALLSTDRSGSPILIAKDGAVIKNPRTGEIRSIDFGKAMGEVARTGEPIQITKPLMSKMSETFQSFFAPIFAVVVFPVFYIWKVVAALLYSLVALLINLARKDKLKYQQLFLVSCYALTPVLILQALDWSTPDFRLHLGFFLSFLLTTAYLAFGIFSGGSGGTKKTSSVQGLQSDPPKI